MPPRKGFGLSLQLPADSAAAPGAPDAGSMRPEGGFNTLRDSWEVGTNGAVTVLSKSITPYQFSSEGMIKAANTQQPQHHYRVSEQDIFVIKTLGRGASSVVSKGFLIRDSKFVALKKINILQKETRQQMMNDVKALCDAPNVPGLINFYGAYHVPDSGQISIVLEYMDGGSLADVLCKVGRIPEGVLSRITARVLQGLAFLHRKHLVHRDIKPANILMNLQGEAKIADFGISAFVANTVANCNTFTGTVTYMSPERIEGKPYSFPADIWSLGLVLVEAATGRYPYDATGGPVELMIQVLHDEPPLPPAGSSSEELRDFIRCCLALDPKRRPNAEQLLQHPFVSRHAPGGPPQPSVPGGESGPAPLATPFEAKQFMSCMIDPLEKMDEISFQFAWMYYAHLSKGADGLRRLGGLYSSCSVMAHQGEVCCGRDAIMAQQQAAAAVQAGFGGAHWRIKAVDSQPLGLDGTMLVHVIGRVTLGLAGKDRSSGAAAGPMVTAAAAGAGGEGGVENGCCSNGSAGESAAAAAAGRGGGGAFGVASGTVPNQPPPSLSCAASSLFAESFILKRSSTGEYFITNQALRTFS